MYAIRSYYGGNVTMSAGNLIANGQRRTIRIEGEIDEPKNLENFVVKTQNGAVYLRDIAQVKFKDVDKTTYAREFGKSVVMLDVKKRAGKNMIEASEKIKEIIKKAEENVFPKDLKITLAVITSYSIHYTKLYDIKFSPKVLRICFLSSAICMASNVLIALSVYSRIANFVISSAPEFLRITSYNVCYTKLLR